jgi:hypothetical protein
VQLVCMETAWLPAGLSSSPQRAYPPDRLTPATLKRSAAAASSATRALITVITCKLSAHEAASTCEVNFTVGVQKWPMPQRLDSLLNAERRMATDVDENSRHLF